MGRRLEGGHVGCCSAALWRDEGPLDGRHSGPGAFVFGTARLANCSPSPLPTRVEQTSALDEAADAHRRQAAGGLTGRIVRLA